MVAASPWIVMPLVGLWRSQPNVQLADFPAEPPPDAPLLSAIIPARNEAHNIEKCARSILASSYPKLELIIVDDHSSDDTGAIAQALAAEDARVRVITPEALPEGWFGKQWACWSGARIAAGGVLCFFDADTTQTPDFLGRSVNVMRARRADFYTAMGAQETGSFWEHVVQPQVFSMMLMRYGGTERMNRSRNAEEKIANGQCILITRQAYFDSGGDEAVKHFEAEDMALAQRFHRLGKTSTAVIAQDSFSTRMYTSLRELVMGWSKNLFVAGFDAMPGGAFGRKLFPLVMLGPAVMGLAPPLGLLLGLLTGSSDITLWGAVTSLAWSRSSGPGWPSRPCRNTSKTSSSAPWSCCPPTRSCDVSCAR
jgi:chlorobactene glucosyltransferase